jgi:phosphoglycolate phosphatase-like HAD superfamily hydrolase
MKPIIQRSSVNRRILLSTLATLPVLTGPHVTVAQAQSPDRPAQAQLPGNALPSWNDGPAKQAILDFVRDTTTPANPKFVPPEERIATFDQDGTLWVEHPLYGQLMYCIDRVSHLTGDRELLKHVPPFSDVLSGNREAIAKLSKLDFELIAVTTLSGMTVEDFAGEVKNWLAAARDPRWKRPYTDLTYLPMQEVMSYLRASGYKTYIVTGGGEEFVRQYSEHVYGIPPTQVVGSAGGTKFGYDKDGKPFLTKDWKLIVNDDNAGKPESIHLMIGQRPYAAFGNSTGDRQMLEYTGAGDGARLMMLVLHDDAQREYAYGPAQGLPDTQVGSFTPELHDEAKKKDWTVISMKNDWKRIFAFE